jgi:TATA-box binding protein (TBP) (component of TFIID and TFIIIB)
MNKDLLRNKILDALIIKKLPDDVLISTITVCCEIDIQFNVDNIAKFIQLKSNGIINICFGKEGDPTTNRTLNPKKKKKKKLKINKKQKREFQNQISLDIMVESKANKPINIKLFKNGSIQMTGCKSVENVVDVLSKIFTELKEVKAIIQKNNNKFQVVEKPFVNDTNKLLLENIKGITIGMINSNFTYPNRIDRLKLFNLLNFEGKDCRYDPSIHAPVNIKFNCTDKSISILVFEKGSILITGAKNCSHIHQGYDFINKYLLLNHRKIMKSNINSENISKYLDIKSDDINTETPFYAKSKRGRKKKIILNNDLNNDVNIENNKIQKQNIDDEINNALKILLE